VIMSHFRTTSGRMLAAMTLGCVWLWGVPARADSITVDWDVVPHQDGDLEPTPYYYCSGATSGSRRCEYLWEEGIELYAVDFSFFDDKWFDGYGFGYAESEIGTGVEGIRPRCEPNLAPCFDAFTPVRLELSGFFNEGDPPNLFVLSSSGAVIKLPSLDGLASIDFQGSAWERLAWLEVGFYMPSACEAEVPPEDLDCSTSREKALVVESLTFQPVPEPTVLPLLGMGMLGVVCRFAAVRRRKSRSTR
jgi:hypothetical protein